jgi:hypothetical protein
VNRPPRGSAHERGSGTNEAEQGDGWEAALDTGTVHDPLQPGVITRVRAAWRGEQSAVALEAMRRAGKAAYAELLHADELRSEALAAGSLWTAAPAVGSQLLAGWNAFVLQTLSEAFLDVDYRTAPGTVGFVPPATFEQVWTWLSAVEGWLSRVQQARRNPDYHLAKELALPAALPDWVHVTPCPRAHLTAMAAALPAIRSNAELAVFAAQRTETNPERQHAVNRLQQLAAEACAAGDYAAALQVEPEDDRLHQLVEDSLKRAIELWFEVGQLASIPALLEQYRVRPPAVQPDPATLPGGRRFDPWRLTDPRTREQWQADPEAHEALRTLWKLDPDPAATLALHAKIEAAVERGDLVRIRTRDGGFCYFCCPWASLFEVRRPLRLAGHDLKVLRQFTVDISAAGLAEGKPFRRELVFGPFEQTDDVGYSVPAGEARDEPPRRRRRRRRR